MRGLITILSMIVLSLSSDPIVLAESVQFTFEEGNNASGDGLVYGSKDPQGFTALMRDGYVFDVLPSGAIHGALHFHEIDSTAISKVPDRPAASRGVLWRDSVAGQDPLVISSKTAGALFTLSSLVLGASSADASATTAVRFTAFVNGNAIGTVELATILDGYTTYTGAALGAIAGLKMDSLQITGLSASLGSYYIIDDLVLEQECPSGSASGHGWSMSYSVCGKDGLVLNDIKLGDRTLAARMSLPYYNLLDRRGNQLAHCHLNGSNSGSGDACESKLINTVEKITGPDKLTVRAQFEVGNIPGTAFGTKLTIAQDYVFGIGASACEPTDGVPCSYFRPMVTYEFLPPQGQTFPQIFPLTINSVQRLELSIDGVRANAGALFQDALVARPRLSPIQFSVITPFTSNPQQLEGVAVAIRNGQAGEVDNYHQTSRNEILEPGVSRLADGFQVIAPGCPECAHIHWRWGKTIKVFNPGFLSANGQGDPIIPVGSDQDVFVALTLKHPGEENPDDYRMLLNGETLLGGSPVFWYSAYGHRVRDTFFMHGGFFHGN